MSDGVIVIGGGPAGSMAALALARAGRQPVLLERDVSPGHRICGEFLSVEAAAAMRAAGLDVARMGAARIDGLRLVHRRRVVETELPFTAWGLSRLAMDRAMLRAAEQSGARVRRGCAVRRLDGMVAETEDGPMVAEALILANGKHELRGAGRDQTGTMDDLIGFKMHYRLAAAQAEALDGAIEVVLFDGGYAGLQRIEGGASNLCLLVSRARFAEVGKSWEALVAALSAETPHLGERLAGARALFAKPLTVSGVPYGFRYAPTANDPPQLYRAGDQLAVIPSFAGDGMALALHSGAAAAAALLDGADARDWHRARSRLVGQQFMIANTLHRVARLPAGAGALAALAGFAPGLVRQIALQTRLPAGARMASNRESLRWR